MALPDIFNPIEAKVIIERIHKLRPDSKALWGRMSTAQMLAHCSETFEEAYKDNVEKPSKFKAWLLHTFVKPNVVSEKPYKKNSRTFSKFEVTEDRDFTTEKNRLIKYISIIVEDGRTPFEGRYSNNFGKLRSEQWNNMFYKHIDHHLKQFGC